MSAIIVAAGTGSRMKAGINKQYLFLNGKPVLAHTLIAFEKCAMIDEIILVINKNDFSICEKDVIRANRLKKVKYMVEGGSSRQESMYNGIKKVHEKADIVLTHDGARPLIHQNTLLKSIEMTLEYGATIVAVPVKETIKVVNEDMEVASTPKRSELWTVQTPQTFSREILVKAHEKALEDGFVGTDDAMLVERLPFPIKIVKGHYDNIKITTPEDLIIAESIFQIVP
ncbi:2-C-methyl-D-erythritol 4-phosphate cytidylyltransferase [Alkalibacter mobilis]|uniref:2-C-methyl-D-erythritol 4-phosphate cytidylyltransferase n=1 Tax=Alkalibacter mobilis TaxID=2787712 RepID=UPI002FC3C473